MAPFRDATDFVRAQAEALRDRRLDELHATPTGWRSVYVQRAARLAAGAAGVLGAMALAGVIAAAPPCDRDAGEAVVVGLALVWSAVLGAGATAALVADHRLRWQVRAGLRPTCDPHDDLIQLASAAGSVDSVMDDNAGAGLPATGDVVGVGDGLGADEAALEVGVDHARRLRRLRALVDGPGLRLLRPRGEERHQAEQRVARADHTAEAGLGEAQRVEEFALLGRVAEMRDLRLDRSRHHDEAGAGLLRALAHAL